MKSSVLLFLSLLLATAILAPSIVTLVNIDCKTGIVMDFNEEEKKETSEKDFLFSVGSKAVSWQQREKITICDFYLESNSTSSIAIFLPPPRLLY